ncbi:MAG: S-methyl-5-thioribose kinase [Anaerolineaceae bacterium]|nr:S-methyl-5-thioribose kinase [Anaerolineaceae bacterium]
MFENHFRMQESDVIQYLLEKTDFFSGDDKLSCKEIGDGNLNYVFRVVSEETDKSIIVKQADRSSRSSKRELSLDRNRIEAELLIYEGQLAPGLVPTVYLYDPVMASVVMEDLSHLRIMRYALMKEERFPRFAEQISDFMAKTLANTSDFVMPSAEKKALTGKNINPDMCGISERLVYTEPYFKALGPGDVAEVNLSYVNDDLQQDEALKAAVAELKMDFMTKAQALIHGDLHTGSIFIGQDEMKVIDPEFAFAGPIGYDVGNVLANLSFAWVRSAVMKADGSEKKEQFQAWAEKAVANSLDLFVDKFKKIIESEKTAPSFRVQAFQAQYMRELVCDSVGVAGLEINRRVIGIAKVADVKTIENEAERALAERILMEIARHFIQQRASYRFGSEIAATIKEMIKTIKV